MADSQVLALRADATPDIGTGHIMRCIALAQEAAARGMRPVLLGTCEVPWLTEVLAATPVTVMDAPDTAEGLRMCLRTLAPAAVVVDAYHIPTAHYRAAATAAPVIAAYDGEIRHACADVLYDQNIGADRSNPPPTNGGLLLRGPAFAVIRDNIRALRPADPVQQVLSRAATPTPRVLLVLGGTDVRRAARKLTKALLQIPALHLTVVTEDSAGVRALPVAPGQQLDVIAPTPVLPQTMAGMDLVISAAGTTTIELCCLGVPAALIQVVDNQKPVYEGAVSHRCAEGLGSISEVLAHPATMAQHVRDLLAQPARRAELAQRAWQMVDGLGRQRILETVTGAAAAR
ncbi:PseG/SpsG family protein [Streptomyces olivoreticuli]|uniref:PseG/SpsG family protein n=1 Tax=Streptomyces olivoreticuli TaxID=68246 RepID=UPI0013C2F1DB|nr:spore coat protein [Streptomyces olivoreticuli]